MPALRPPYSYEVLRRILNPRSVAVIGASASPAKFGGRALKFLLQHGFEGEVVPINPGATTILGRPAYSSIAAAPLPVDVALLAVPSARMATTLEECGRAGVAGCVVLSADFAEAGPEGAQREAELVRIARAHGMRLIGPNCLGFINPKLRLALTSSVALAVEPMPRGNIGLISQSGSLMASLISHAQDTGAGFSIAVSVGNQADLDVCDFIEYFLGDGGTQAICAYVEGLRDAPRFLELASRCLAAKKPLLVVKAGASPLGAQIALSHTASLAGANAAWSAAAREHGVVLLDDAESLIYCAHFLTRFAAPQGDGIAALSPSGGTVAITADRLAASGLRLAAISDETTAALQQIVPSTRVLNPLDIGGLAGGLDTAVRCYELLADNSDTSLLFIVVATTPDLVA
jgi:acyl-CoA synthetase (NDP forming)